MGGFAESPIAFFICVMEAEEYYVVEKNVKTFLFILKEFNKCMCQTV